MKNFPTFRPSDLPTFRPSDLPIKRTYSFFTSWIGKSLSLICFIAILSSCHQDLATDVKTINQINSNLALSKGFTEADMSDAITTDYVNNLVKEGYSKTNPSPNSMVTGCATLPFSPNCTQVFDGNVTRIVTYNSRPSSSCAFSCTVSVAYRLRWCIINGVTQSLEINNFAIGNLNNCPSYINCMATLSDAQRDLILEQMLFDLSTSEEFFQMGNLLSIAPVKCSPFNGRYAVSNYTKSNCYTRCFSFDATKENPFIVEQISCGTQCCRRESRWCINDSGFLIKAGPTYRLDGEPCSGLLDANSCPAPFGDCNKLCGSI